MTRPRTLISAIVIAAMVAAGSVTVRAIVYGFVDTNNTFSNVGAFIVRAPSGRISPICSGTLIAPDVFLTASHCTIFFERNLAPLGFTAFVTFDNPVPFGSLTSGSTNLIQAVQVVTNPRFNQSQSDSGDIAVLLVSAADTVGVVPAMLPGADLLEELSSQNGLKNASFTVAGYGVQNRIVGGGTPFFTELNPAPRMYAFESFDALNKGYLRLSQNPATGNGGACFGDSGGPNFLDSTGGLVLVAITITGDAVCRSTNVVYRVDTTAARAFLAAYVDLP
jgi:hypothetical protein